MPKKVYSSSTPIKRNFDPVSKNSNSSATSCCMSYEKIYPGIYLTSVKDLCPADDLKIYGFTHIIYIDKHAIQINDTTRSCLSHKSTTSQAGLTNNASTSITASITIRHSSESATNQNQAQSNQSSSKTILHDAECSLTALSSSSSLSSSPSLFNAQGMPIDDEPSIGKTFSTFANNEYLFGHNDFETLDLNFGESSYLTTVLPNCYKAVKFIERALKNNGAVLVIDCIGESQKCITIVIGFLMYKYNKNFL